MTALLERSPGVVNRMQALVDGVDHLAVEMERKWGVGRLRLLVSPDLREKFDRQAQKWNDAIWSAPLHEVEEHAGGMTRGWKALDAAAMGSGQKPLAPVVWEVRLSSGRVVALVRDGSEAHQVARDARYVEVWTMEEIARVIEAFPEIAKAKEVFPGALVTEVRTKTNFDWANGDGITP